ncbi:MAG: universal stress protein [Janthinobacterium lividum]
MSASTGSFTSGSAGGGPDTPAAVVAGYEPGDEHAVLEALLQARMRHCPLVVVAGAPLPDGVLALARDSGVAYRVLLPQPEGADVVEAVLDLAERGHAQLLVMGLRRRGVEDLLGGRARLVVLDAPCPVLAVPEPDTDFGSCARALAVTMGV